MDDGNAGPLSRGGEGALRGIPSVSDFSKLKSGPVRSGEPALTESEIHRLRPNVPYWMVNSVEGVKKLEREFLFQDFRSALEFANQVGALAEAEGHHPAILVQWGKVRVSWWTHKIGGLHRNDFIMAAKTEELHRARNSPSSAGEPARKRS